jgi:hypothetical protein
LAVIVALLADSNRLRLFLAHPYAHPAFGCCDAELPIAQLAHEVEGLLRRLLASKPQRVGFDRLLHRVAHLLRSPEESVGGHEPLERLVRTMEVVVIDEEREPPFAIRVVGEDRPRQKLVPQRLPESLDLAQRLRVLRPALHVTDPVATQQLLEGRLAPPRRVLPPLIGQDLFRRAVACQRPFERFEHQLGLLVMRQRVSDHEARVIVHEADQVQTLVPAQQECEEVRLPHLIGQRSLEASRRLRSALPFWRCRLDQALFVQHAADRVLRHAESFEAAQRVSYASRPRLRLCLLRLDHRVSSRIAFERFASTLSSGCEGHQTVNAVRSEPQHPVAHRLQIQSEDLRHGAVALSSIDHLPDHAQPQLHRVHHVRLLAGLASARRTTPSPAFHHLLRSHSGSLSGGSRRVVLSVFRPAHTRINWLAGHVRTDGTQTLLVAE